MTDQQLSKCDDCGHIFDASAEGTEEVRDFWSRISPGEIMPSGECPKCEALAYPIQTNDEKRQAPASLYEPVKRRLLQVKTDHITDRLIVALKDCGIEVSDLLLARVDSAVMIALGEIEG